MAVVKLGKPVKSNLGGPNGAMAYIIDPAKTDGGRLVSSNYERTGTDYDALSEEWRKRDGEDDDPWENHGPDGYQPPSYEPVNPERRTAQTPSDGLI